jgi:DNA-binding MarR family transcriptional regulator
VAASRSARTRLASESDAGVDPSIGGAMVGISRLTEIALGEANVSVTQYRILHHLHRGRSIQSDLAFRLAVSKQSVTRIVDTLVEKGYIKRRVDPDDRRRVIHAITAQGERALTRVDEILERYLLMILQDLEDDDDIEATKAALRLFAQASAASYARVGPESIEPGRLAGGTQRGLPAYIKSP